MQLTDGLIADLRGLSDVLLQVKGLSGGDTIRVSRSVEGVLYDDQTLVKNDFTTPTVISSDGVYASPGRTFFKFTRIGSASNPTISFGGN